MTLGQLRAFLALADTGSVRAAAERLVVTQPAVSAALASLQRELGVALVAKEGRGLRLTPAGQAFAGYARRALGLLDEAVAAAGAEADPEHGRLRLAAVTTAGERLVPSLLASFRSEHPQVEVALEVGNRRRVFELLANHEADLGIAGRPPPAFATLALRPHALVVVAAPTAGRRRKGVRPVSVADLAGTTWLLREPGSGTRAAAEELLRDLELEPPVLTLGSNGAIQEGVRLGLGVTLISRDAVAPDLDAGTLVEWRCPPLPLERAWHTVGRSGENLSPTALLFLDHLDVAGWQRSAQPVAGPSGSGRAGVGAPAAS